MSNFLEMLKSRLEEARKRASEADQNLKRAQAEFQSAAQEFTSWQIAVASEIKKQPDHNLATVPAQESPLLETNHHASEPTGDEGNKTEAVRRLLRQHPAGMTPPEIWKEVRNLIAHRPYLYSVLKRLKDKNEVMVRRGKYVLRVPAMESDGGQQQLTQ